MKIKRSGGMPLCFERRYVELGGHGKGGIFAYTANTSCLRMSAASSKLFSSEDASSKAVSIAAPFVTSLFVWFLNVLVNY